MNALVYIICLTSVCSCTDFGEGCIARELENSLLCENQVYLVSEEYLYYIQVALHNVSGADFSKFPDLSTVLVQSSEITCKDIRSTTDALIFIDGISCEPTGGVLSVDTTTAVSRSTDIQISDGASVVASTTSSEAITDRASMTSPPSNSLKDKIQTLKTLLREAGKDEWEWIVGGVGGGILSVLSGLVVRWIRRRWCRRSNTRDLLDLTLSPITSANTTATTDLDDTVVFERDRSLRPMTSSDDTIVLKHYGFVDKCAGAVATL